MIRKCQRIESFHWIRHYAGMHNNRIQQVLLWFLTHQFSLYYGYLLSVLTHLSIWECCCAITVLHIWKQNSKLKKLKKISISMNTDRRKHRSVFWRSPWLTAEKAPSQPKCPPRFFGTCLQGRDSAISQIQGLLLSYIIYTSVLINCELSWAHFYIKMHCTFNLKNSFFRSVNMDAIAVQ